MSAWSPEEIIVDLTNGTKSYTDFVYLACTLLDIQTIFRVFIDREYYNNPDIDGEYFEVKMESILSQNQVRSFVNKTYAEYIYYYSEVRELSEWVKCLYDEQVSLSFFRQMIEAFEKYANNDYQGCINALSTATEELIEKLLHRLKNNFDSDTWDWLTLSGRFSRNRRNTSQNSRFVSLGSLSRDFGNIMTRANKIISGISDQSTELYSREMDGEIDDNIYKLAPIVAVGHALQAMSITRNYNAHGSNFSRENGTIHDARFQIDIMLFILHKMAECELLRGE